MLGIPTAAAVPSPFPATALLSVNPAFLQEIKDSNPDYWESVKRLQHICHSHDDPTVQCRNFVKELDHLRDTIALQFSLEESYGYIAIGDRRDLSASELPISEKTTQTLAEHPGLYMSLSELTEWAEELQYRGVEFRTLRELNQRVMDFILQLQAHERDEAELIEVTLASLKSPYRRPPFEHET
jgi:hypothetical protein